MSKYNFNHAYFFRHGFRVVDQSRDARVWSKVVAGRRAKAGLQICHLPHNLRDDLEFAPLGDSKKFKTYRAIECIYARV